MYRKTGRVFDQTAQPTRTTPPRVSPQPALHATRNPRWAAFGIQRLRSLLTTIIDKFSGCTKIDAAPGRKDYCHTVGSSRSRIENVLPANELRKRLHSLNEERTEWLRAEGSHRTRFRSSPGGWRPWRLAEYKEKGIELSISKLKI